MSNVVYIARGPKGWGSSIRRAIAAARRGGGSLTVLSRHRHDSGSVAAGDLPVEVRPLPPGPWAQVLGDAIPADTDIVVKVASGGGVPGHQPGGDLELLRGLQCSLWLVSALRSEEPPGPVLAAVALDDASAALDRAVLRAARLVAAVEQVPLCVVHTWNLIGESICSSHTRGIGPSRARRVLRRIRREHQARLDALLADCLAAEEPRLLLKGTVPQGIREALGRTGATALVLGYHGRTGVWRWIQPNLAESFLEVPGVSLVAVRPPGREAAGAEVGMELRDAAYRNRWVRAADDALEWRAASTQSPPAHRS